MAIKKAETKKIFAVEQQPLVRLLASGTKLTDATMANMKLKAGVAQEKDKETKEVTVEGKPGDNIHYAVDDETGKVYLYKASKKEGAVIGATKSFTSNSLKAKLLKLAAGADIIGGTGKIALDTKIKDNLQIVFNVAETPESVDGTDYFEVTFKEASLEKKADKKEAKSDAPVEAPVKEAAKSDNW